MSRYIDLLMRYFNHIRNDGGSNKWYIIFVSMIINSMSQLFKLVTYKHISDYIMSVILSGQFKNVNDGLMSFFMMLFVAHFAHKLTTMILEKVIISRVRELFNNIINRITHNKLDFFRKDATNKINQIWLYFNNIEFLLTETAINVPNILVFSLYYLYIIYNYSPFILFMLIPIHTMIIFILRPISNKQKKLQSERHELDLDVKNRVMEITSNIEFVKLSRRENYESERICDTYQKYTRNKLFDKELYHINNFISDVFKDIVVLSIYSFGTILMLNKNDHNVPGDLLYIGLCTCMFYNYIIQLNDIYNNYNRIIPKIDILCEMLNDNTLEKDMIYPVNMDIESKINKDVCIEFDDVTFSYDKKNNVLVNTSFIFYKNRINLLLGPNGSGKSTVVKLLLRLYEDNSLMGKIRINGNDIYNERITNLRKNIVFVTNETHLFNDTIMNNLKYGNDNKTDDYIIEKCKELHLYDWVIKNGNRSIGYRGKEISGGERKKIQLVNSLCRDADIIIFDEPTNTLDSHGMEWFIKFINLIKIKFSKTVIIITHDTRLLESSDNTIKL